MAVTSFKPDKMYTYLRGFASGACMKETLKKPCPLPGRSTQGSGAKAENPTSSTR